MNNRLHHDGGFTLIELLITVALFAILATMAASGYQSMVQNGRIRTAADAIHAGLQIARAEAVKRNTSVQFDLRGTHSAWTVCVTPAAPGNCPDPDDDTTIQSRKASEGSSDDIQVTESDSGPYVFNNLGILTSPAPAGAMITIDIDNSAMSATDSRDLRVEIGAGGSLKVCDPALTGSDPRKCS